MLKNVAGNFLITHPHDPGHFRARMSNGKYLVPYGDKLSVERSMSL